MKTATAAETAQAAFLLNRLQGHIAAQPADGNPSLLGGQMGFALFEAYYQGQMGQSDTDRIWERISYSLRTIQSGEILHSFAAGIAGITWGFLHLFNHGLLTDDELDPNDVVEDLDEPLFQVSMDLLKSGNFDYLHGGLSACLYFLERRPSDELTQYIEKLVEQLAAVAVRLPDGGITWRFDNYGRRPIQAPDLYNLGLSHGTASVVAILSLLYEKGYARALCAEMIQGALQWIWNNRNEAGHSVFPNTVEAVKQDYMSRLAWCYGDLGIANTFWLAGEKLDNPDWRAVAEQIIRRAATRRKPDETLINDSGLCHGSAGAAYIFRLFARRLQDPLLTEAADFWLQKTFDAALTDTDEQVFLQYNPLEKKHVPNPGLLEGEAGIGLLLLSEMGAPTYWDRFLLLS